MSFKHNQNYTWHNIKYPKLQRLKTDAPLNIHSNSLNSHRVKLVDGIAVRFFPDGRPVVLFISLDNYEKIQTIPDRISEPKSSSELKTSESFCTANITDKA